MSEFDAIITPSYRETCSKEVIRMSYTATFERIEKKLLMTEDQYRALLPVLRKYMCPDIYFSSTNCSLYMDTPDFLLVRRALSKPEYKEKMRLRSYGVPGMNDPVFLEIKKKYDRIVYKRRISLGAEDAMNYLEKGMVPTPSTQILREIDYMRSRYQLIPAMVLCYDRHSYAEREESVNSLRITIDKNIRYRMDRLDLRKGDDGTLLLAPGTRLMEVKTTQAIPLWLAHAMTETGISMTSFSKYGHAYETVSAASSQHIILSA